jgi:hypothetical protein
VRKLRETVAHNRKRVRDAVALRPHATPSPPPEHPAAAGTNGRFRSLQALAGRAIPLDQPSQLIVLNLAYAFTQDPFDSETSSNLAQGNVFFRTVRNQTVLDETPFAFFGLTYLWVNGTDSPMLVDVLTALDLYGAMTVNTPGYNWLHGPLPYSAQSSVSGQITLGSSWDSPITDGSQEYIFASVQAHSMFFQDQEGWEFNHEHHDMSYTAFYLPPNSPLIINVWTVFETDFRNSDGNSSDDYGYFDFSFENPNFRIGCPGVVLIATPVTMF